MAIMIGFTEFSCECPPPVYMHNLIDYSLIPLFFRVRIVLVHLLKYRRQNPPLSLMLHSSSLGILKKINMFLPPTVSLSTAPHVTQNYSVGYTSYLIYKKQSCICTTSQCLSRLVVRISTLHVDFFFLPL